MKVRLRFSVRTLFFFVTLVCLYFGAWELTERWGLHRDVPPDIDGVDYLRSDVGRLTTRTYSHVVTPRGTLRRVTFQEYSPMPFVICHEEGRGLIRQKYYVWLFGPKFELPFESTWDGRWVFLR